MPQIKHGRWVTALGASASSSLDLRSETLVGLYTPALLDAAQLQLQASHDGTSFFNVYDGGGPLRLQGDKSAYISVNPSKLVGAAYVRLSHVNSSGTSVAESAERVFTPVFRAFE